MIKSLILLGIIASLALAQSIDYIKLVDEGFVRTFATDGTYSYVGTYNGVLVKLLNSDMSRVGTYYHPAVKNVQNITISSSGLFVAYNGNGTITIAKINANDLTLIAYQSQTGIASDYGVGLYADSSYVYVVSNPLYKATSTIEWYDSSSLAYVNSISTESYGRLIGVSNAIMYFAANNGVKKVSATTMAVSTTTVDWSQYTVQSSLLVGSTVYLIAEGSGTLDHSFVTIDTVQNQINSLNIGDLPATSAYSNDPTKRTAAVRLQLDQGNNNRIVAFVVGYQCAYYGGCRSSGDFNPYIIDLTTKQVTKKAFNVPGEYTSQTVPSFIRINDYIVYNDMLLFGQYQNLPVYCKYDAAGVKTCASSFVNAQTKYAKKLIYARNNLAYSTSGNGFGCGGYNLATGKTPYNTSQTSFDLYYDGHYIYGYNAIYIDKIDPDTLLSVDTVRIPNYPYDTFYSMITYQGEVAFFDRADGALKRFNQAVIKTIPGYTRVDSSIYVTIDPSGRYVFFFEGDTIKRYDFDTNTYKTVASQGAANEFKFYGGYAYSTGVNFDKLIKFKVDTMEHIYTQQIFTYTGAAINFYYYPRKNLEFHGDNAYMGVDGVGLIKINLVDGSIVATYPVAYSGVFQLAQGPNAIYFAGSYSDSGSNWIGYLTLESSGTSTPTTTGPTSGPGASSSPSTSAPTDATNTPSQPNPTENLSGDNMARSSAVRATCSFALVAFVIMFVASL
jgi:hypothetical protein